MARIELISRDEAFTVGDADCAFTIRRLSPDLVWESRQRHTRRLQPEGPGQPPPEECDEAEVNKDILDYIIQGWRGVLGVDGQEAPCTRENKHHLPAQVKERLLDAAQAVNRQGVKEITLPFLGPSPATAAPASPATPDA